LRPACRAQLLDLAGRASRALRKPQEGAAEAAVGLTIEEVIGRLLVASMVVAACGRIRFDPLGAGDANGDGNANDSAPTLSCAGLATTCGPSGTSPCCGSPLVPGGTFYRSYDVASDGMYTSMLYPATLSSFRLDTYQVTVGRFRQFVTAGVGTQANPPVPGAGARALNGMASQGGWDPAWNASLLADQPTLIGNLACSALYQSWTPAPGANEGLPINCITWYEAFAFCAWDGGFLPTEAEWNYAAAGGTDQRAYPWSNPAGDLTIDCSYANYYLNSPPGTYCVNGTNGGVNRVGSESPTGDGRWTQADLGGNLWEWTLDWFGSYPGVCDDCAALTATSGRVIRGGNYAVGEVDLRAGQRYVGFAPDGRNSDIGVRCARAP
jgi:formylglycine-generating enzyme required for sulfatase activity